MPVSKYFSKGSKLYSILKFKCPHCHEGEFFKSANPYDLKSMSETYASCPNCSRKISIEPGFYYGAMYISYALGVAHIVAFLIFRSVLNLNLEFWNFIILVGTFLILLTPLYYALSKIIWANLFIHYKLEQNDEKH